MCMSTVGEYMNPGGYVSLAVGISMGCWCVGWDVEVAAAKQEDTSCILGLSGSEL